MAAQSLLSESVLGWSIFTFILLVSECKVVEWHRGIVVTRTTRCGCFNELNFCLDGA